MLRRWCRGSAHPRSARCGPWGRACASSAAEPGPDWWRRPAPARRSRCRGRDAPRAAAPVPWW